jgi:hypothetical protein
MNHNELFRLAVRILGLVFLYIGLRSLPAGLGQMLASFPHRVGPGITSHMSFSGFFGGIVMVVWPLLLSYWLMRGAPAVMRIAFPESEPTSH